MGNSNCNQRDEANSTIAMKTTLEQMRLNILTSADSPPMVATASMYIGRLLQLITDPCDACYAHISAEHDAKQLLKIWEPSGPPSTVETDLTMRWEQKIPHHPHSMALFNILRTVDEKYGGDTFDWRCGGDGDNGETLMYELDIYFELLEANNTPVSTI